MFRKSLPKGSVKNDFRLRGHEVRRIETFSDAVFAFAVTLLIVSLEVPKTFEELMISIRGFFAFGVSFLILMQIWNEQNVFFRRYGFDDEKIQRLNIALIFLVLFYVYPLKFLFTLLFSNEIYINEPSPFVIKDSQLPELMMIYGIGYVIIYFLFFLMYRHAYKNRAALELNEIEKFDTKTKMGGQTVLIIIGLISVLLAYFLPNNLTGLAGFFYIIIAPALSVFYSVRGKKRRMLLTQLAKNNADENAETINDEKC